MSVVRIQHLPQCKHWITGPTHYPLATKFNCQENTASAKNKHTGFRYETDGGFISYVFSITTTQDPFNDTDVLSKAGPQELAVLIRTEPVHMEDLGHLKVKKRLGKVDSIRKKKEFPKLIGGFKK